MTTENFTTKHIKTFTKFTKELHFEDCHEFLFSRHFENSHLNLSSFYKRKLKKTDFKDCGLQEIDFTETDLTGAVFDNCDFNRATFSNTILEKQISEQLTITPYIPDVNRIEES